MRYTHHRHRSNATAIEEHNFEIIEKEKQILEEETGGISQEVSERELTEYMDLVTEERRRTTGFGAKG